MFEQRNLEFDSIQSYMSLKQLADMVETDVILQEANSVGMKQELIDETMKYLKYSAIINPMEVLRMKYNELIEDKL